MSNNKQQRYEQWAEQAVMYPFPFFAHEPFASRPESPLIPPSPAHIIDKAVEYQDDFSSLLHHIKSLNLQQKDMDVLVNEVVKLSRNPTPYPSPLHDGKLKVNELKLTDEGFSEECGQPGILSPDNPLHKNTTFSLSPLRTMSPSPNPPQIILEPIENRIINKINGKSKHKHKPPPILMYSQDSVRSSISSNIDASVTFSTQTHSGRTFGSQASTPSRIDEITVTDDEGMVSDVSEDIDDLTLEEILNMGKEKSVDKLDSLRQLPLDNRINWNNLKNSPRIKHVLQLVPGAQTPPSMRQSPIKSPYPSSLPMSMDDIADFESSRLKEEIVIDEEPPLNQFDVGSSKPENELLVDEELLKGSSLDNAKIKGKLLILEEILNGYNIDSTKLNEDLMIDEELLKQSNINYSKLKDELLKAEELINKSTMDHTKLEEESDRSLVTDDGERFKRRFTRLHYELSFHKPHSVLYGKLLNPRNLIKSSVPKLYNMFANPTFTCVILAVIIGVQFTDYIRFSELQFKLLA